MVPTWRLTISLAITKRRITNKKNLWLLAYLLQHIYSYLKPTFIIFMKLAYGDVSDDVIFVPRTTGFAAAAVADLQLC